MKNTPQSKSLNHAPKIATIALGALLAGCTAKDNSGNCYDLIGNYCPDESNISQVENPVVSNGDTQQDFFVNGQSNLRNTHGKIIAPGVSGDGGVIADFFVDVNGDVSLNQDEIYQKIGDFGLNLDSPVYMEINSNGAIVFENTTLGIQENVFNLLTAGQALNADLHISQQGARVSKSVLEDRKRDYYEENIQDINSNILEQRIEAARDALYGTQGRTHLEGGNNINVKSLEYNDVALRLLPINNSDGSASVQLTAGVRFDEVGKKEDITYQITRNNITGGINKVTLPGATLNLRVGDTIGFSDSTGYLNQVSVGSDGITHYLIEH